MATIVATRGSSKEKFFQELGLESLQLRRWYRNLGMFDEIFKSKSPQYLFKLIPKKISSYVTRNVNILIWQHVFNIKHNFYKNSFFPSAIIEWNNLDSNLWNSESFGTFENNILIFIRPKPTSCLNCCNHKGIILITQLRLGLSHLHEHKFKTISKIVWIYFVVVVWVLNRPLIFFSTVPYLIINDIPSWELK